MQAIFKDPNNSLKGSSIFTLSGIPYRISSIVGEYIVAETVYWEAEFAYAPEITEKYVEGYSDNSGEILWTSIPQ